MVIKLKKIKIYKFNNLNKNINISIYNINYIISKNIYKNYITYINNKYSSKKLTKILKKICLKINAKILNISKQDYIPQGASTTILISENKKLNILSHLDKSHICIHTYPENYPNTNIYCIRIDINISTCGLISPLKCINYIIKKFKSDIITIDYIIRGFTRDINGKKYFIDHKINSIQNFINKNIKNKYELLDINIYQENIFNTKMIKKKININNYIFDNYKNNFNKNLNNKKILSLLWKEMYEIYYSKNTN